MNQISYQIQCGFFKVGFLESCMKGNLKNSHGSEISIVEEFDREFEAPE